MPSIDNVDYNKVLEAYQTVDTLCPLEGDTLSLENGKLVRVNRVLLNWENETLIPVLKGINEAAKNIFEELEENKLELAEEEKAEFFRLRSTFATRMGDLAFRYQDNRYSKLRPVFSESYNAHKLKDYSITANNPIDFTRERQIFGEIIPHRRDQNEDLAVIRDRISEAKSHLLPKANHIAKMVGKYFILAPLFLPLFLIDQTLNTALAGLKILGLLRNVHSLELYDWVDSSVSNKLFPSLKANSIAKSALNTYAYQLKNETVWDEERFELFESVAPFLKKDPEKTLALGDVQLKLDKKAYLEMGLSDDKQVNQLATDVIEKLEDGISSNNARSLGYWASLRIKHDDLSDPIRRAEFVNNKVEKCKNIEDNLNPLYTLMTPDQLIRYLEIFKKHTHFRTVAGIDRLVTGSDKQKNQLFGRIEEMGFTVTLLDL